MTHCVFPAITFDCGYGHSGTGKSRYAALMAEHLYETTGEKARLYIGDGGLATYEARGLIEDGIMEAVEYTDYNYPFTTYMRITEGCVPVDPGNPDSKWVKKHDGIGLWIFEGLSVLSDYIMGQTLGGLSQRGAAGEKIGQDSPIQIIDPSGERFGGNPISHYSVVQRNIITAMQKSKRLPGRKFWTAHEKMAEDKEENNAKVIGPDAGGKALTPKLPLWFGNTLHFTTAAKKSKTADGTTGAQAQRFELERRMYTRTHGDPDGIVFIPYLANTRIADDDKDPKAKNVMPEYLVPPDPVTYYRIIGEAKAALRKRRAA